VELNTPRSTDVRLPEALNTVSLRALGSSIEAAFSSSARVICVRGATEAVFCSGLALDSEDDADLPDVRELAALFGRLLDAPRPVLAIVDGASLGGGVGLAAACDWVIATERATFGLPELLWGLLPAIIWPVLTERMAPRAVKAWLLTAHAHPAQDALAEGLVDEIVPNLLDTRISRRIRSLARVEPGALVRLRRLSRDTRQHHINDALPEGARITSDLLTHPIVRARLAAFRRGEAPWES